MNTSFTEINFRIAIEHKTKATSRCGRDTTNTGQKCEGSPNNTVTNRHMDTSYAVGVRSNLGVRHTDTSYAVGVRSIVDTPRLEQKKDSHS